MPKVTHTMNLEFPAHGDDFDDLPSLGPCCICEKSGPTVRTIVTLSRRAPDAEKGWGCLTCGIQGGAVAVVCDDCAGLVDEYGRNLDPTVPDRLRFACRGYPAEDGRIPIADLDPTRFDHDPRAHRDEIAVSLLDAARADDHGDVWTGDARLDLALMRERAALDKDDPP